MKATLFTMLLLVCGSLAEGGHHRNKHSDIMTHKRYGNLVKPITIEVIMPIPDGEFWPILYNGVMAAAKNTPHNVHVKYVNIETPAGEPGHQSEQDALTNDALDRRVDGIITHITTASALGSKTGQRFMESNTHLIVVNVGRIVAEYNDTPYVGQEEVRASREAGNKLSNLGGTKLLCLNYGPPKLGNQLQRCTDAAQTFRGKTITQSMSGDKEANLRIIKNALRHHNIDAILGYSADLTTQAVRAATMHSRKVVIGGFDLSPEVLHNLENSKQAFAIDQQPFMEGYLAVQYMFLYLYNGNVPYPEQTNVLTGPIIIEKKDVTKQLKMRVARQTR